MALADVLKDPNYVNANAATKAAIFDKFSAGDPNYVNANDATKAAIRTKFGLTTEAETPVMAPAVEVSAAPKQDMVQKYGYPVLEATLPTLGAIVGGGGATVFGPAGTIAGGTAGAGLGYGAAKELERLYEEKTGKRAPQALPQSAAEAAQNVLLGATFEAGGRVVLPQAAKALGWLWDKSSGKLVQIKAGKIVQELAGPKLEALIAATKTAPEGVTAAQAVANVEAAPIQTLGKRAVEKMPYTYRPIEQAQEGARIAALKEVTPDKAAVEAARTAVAEPLYKEAAKTVIPMDAELKAVFNRLPEGTIEAARKIAKMEGRPFTFGETVPGVETATRTGGTPQISGESLHYIKRALSDIANAADASKGVGRDAQNAARGVLSDFLSTVESKIKPYGQAREAFRVGSEPVNQAVVLNEMRAILEAPGGGERAKPFINALGKGEQALLKKATGMARYEEGDLAKVLTPEQMNTVTKIANELMRNIKMAEQAKAGQTMYEDVIRANTKATPRINMLNVKTTLANETMDILESKLNKKVMSQIMEGMRTGKSFRELLEIVPAKDRVFALQVVQRDPIMQSLTSQSVNALTNQ